MTDGTDACLITLPVMEFSSTISRIEVDTATVLEELSVLEKVVVTDAEGLRGVIHGTLMTRKTFCAPVIPPIDTSLAPCTYSFACYTLSADLGLISDDLVYRYTSSDRKRHSSDTLGRVVCRDIPRVSPRPKCIGCGVKRKCSDSLRNCVMLGNGHQRTVRLR
jgi:hypothetical protein